jgi:predicted Zn-dependent protease
MPIRLPFRFTNIATALAIGCAVTACSSGNGKNLLALEDEKTEVRVALAEKIGTSPQEVAQALDSTPQSQRAVALAVTERVKNRYGTSSDVAMQRHLQNISDNLARGMNVPARNFNVVLIKNSQANAFTPGAGAILVNEGLLQISRNEAEVAAVMAHEMAHVLMKHPQRQKQIRLASKAGSSFMDRFTPERLQDNIGQLLRLSGNATMNGMIRQQEMMADSIAIDMLVKAGYEPRAMVQILRTLRGNRPQKDRLTNVVYGNHPLTIDREKAAVEKINKMYQAVSGLKSTPKFDALVKPYHEKRLKRLAQRG